MLRRQPTAIALTSEDIAAYEKSRRAAANGIDPRFTAAGNSNGERSAADPNDELKPFPQSRLARTGDGAAREERIQGR